MDCDHCLTGKFLIGRQIKQWRLHLVTWWFCRGCWTKCTGTPWS